MVGKDLHQPVPPCRNGRSLELRSPLFTSWPELETLILNAGNVAQFSNAAPESTGGKIAKKSDRPFR
jgi:hypothetical protein